MGDVLGNLAELGFSAAWFNISAASIGALHERQRIWIVAHADDQGEPTSAIHDETRRLPPSGEILHAERWLIALGQRVEGARQQFKSLPWDRVWPHEDSPLGMGMADGLSSRMDRLRSLGNAVVPQIPELIGRAIAEADRAA